MYLKKVTILHDKFPTEDFYPFNLEIFRKTENLHFESPVTIFTGENGTGKSTLLEALSRKCGIYIWEGEHRPRQKNNPYFKQMHSAINVEWKDGPVPGSFFSSDVHKHFSALLDEWEISNPGLFEYFGGKSLVTQSHGQGIISFFKARYKIKGLYLMDEPETALSPANQIKLVNIFKEMSENGHAQFILATHSPILMACPGAKLLNFDNNAITETTYYETQHYMIYKNFMEDSSRYI
jgi:predicted ATPase